MRDYQSFKDLYRYVHDEEKDNCRKCPRVCYSPDATALFFDTSETTDTVFISESPYNYPNKERGVNRSDDFVRRELQPRLEACQRSGVVNPPESKPKDIFEFIYHVFRPIFDAKPRGSWAEVFLKMVYWTHVGKKSFKPYKTSERMRYGRQCARQLLLQELQAAQPRTVIMASGIASKILLGSGFQELLRRESSRYLSDGSFLRLEDECKPNSLLGESLRKGDFPSSSACELAIFPNPSPIAGKWKELAYQKDRETKKIKRIHEKLRSQIY